MNDQQLIKEEKEEHIIDYGEIENMTNNQVEKYLNKNNKKENKESLVKRVFDFLDENPKSETKDLVEEFPDDNSMTLSKYKSNWKLKNPDLNKDEPKEIKKNPNPIVRTIEVLRQFIIKTDPELLDNLELFRELYKFKEKLK